MADQNFQPTSPKVQKMETDDQSSTAHKLDVGDINSQPDLREMSIILDGWARTCDLMINTITDQMNKLKRAA